MTQSDVTQDSGFESGRTGLSPGDLAELSASLYSNESWFLRLKQKYRPYICPFDVVLNHVPEGASVIDVGCGAGLFLGLLAAKHRIRSGFGFDSNKDAISAARRMQSSSSVAESCSALQFEQIDVDEDWPDQSFECVSMIDVLHHIPRNRQRAVFTEAASHLSSNGRLVYKDIAPRPRWRAAANTLHDLVLAQDLPRYIDEAQLGDWAARAGLRIRLRSVINRLWYAHLLMVFEKT